MHMKRLLARVAACRAAIEAARLAGATWAEIGERLGATGGATRKAYLRSQIEMQAGRLVPIEQSPLPELVSKTAPAGPA